MTSSDNFGPNQGFIEDLYMAFLNDPSSVGPQWSEMFRRWQLEGRPPREGNAVGNTTQAPEPVTEETSEQTRDLQRQVYNTSDRETTAPTNVTRPDLPPQPRAAIRPAVTPYAQKLKVRMEHDSMPTEDEFLALKGMDRGLAKNMDASLSLPTATSVRAIPARVMFDNRTVINKHLAASRGGKISFTHMIAYAMVEALAEMPEMNYHYTINDTGKPTLVNPAHVNLGLAIDVKKPDGSSTLVVPNIKAAETMSFSEFVSAYEELVRRGRENALTIEDYQNTTASLTNPGGFGTVHSIPRLMNGQGLIVGVGAMTYPAEFAGTSDKTLARLGVSKVVHLTSTYDHRVIQGATSGRFLRLFEKKLLGLDGLYDRMFVSLHVPYKPYLWETDVEYNAQSELDKPARIAELIHAFRSRGHLIADVDPLSFHVRRHPDLELQSYGLTLWDLDRSFPTGGFAGTSRLTLREILDQLRETYARTVGIEYMHIMDPQQRKWFQERLELPQPAITPDKQEEILRNLNNAEAFETFLQTKYVGQKRFSLEGGESLIPALAEILSGAAHDGLSEVAIGMAHRGRLNVLTNIAGKSFRQIFSEFDGIIDPSRTAGSGDVKYHLGTSGVFTAPSGEQVPVYVAANPSHLEAADGVLEGVVRAKEDRLKASRVQGTSGTSSTTNDEFSVLPIMIHGDAAFSGQGVVAEVLNYSQLPAYRTGGTIHIIVNNQIGFTTSPSSARSTRYTTDIAKGLQMPVFHINGDDPEAVVRTARIAYDYRQAFNKDVILDITCYRKRGHNEGDDPSMTQPIMYSLVDSKRTTRQLYRESLIGRGQLTAEKAEAFEKEFHDTLDAAFNDVRDAEAAEERGEKTASEALGLTGAQQLDVEHVEAFETSIPAEVMVRIGEAHTNMPEGFHIHKKVGQLFNKRAKMAHEGKIDWGFGELLAFGSLLIDGVPIRMSGQDARRATFVQRHAVAHDITTGEEWTPLANLTEDQAELAIYDSSLSEYSVLAFEYGYSVERPDALVLWEAQFGDFANGAQTVIDEFVSSAEQKWNQRSSLVMLLPHGYEGQGPDHSSARIERYLQLAAEGNMTIAQPSTPANHFHLLRHQAFNRPRKPLIVFTPKQLLRRKGAVSSVDEFTSGHFRPVIGETDGSIQNVDRVIMCTGRLYYDLLEQRQALGDAHTALVRIEQLYPNPVDELQAELSKYQNAELLWVQDEPGNQGAWPHLQLEMFLEMGLNVRKVSRPNAAAPSTGLTSVHKAQAKELLDGAFRR